MDRPTPPWPAVNAHVDVRPAGSAAWLASRVEDHAGDAVVVAAPSAPGVGILPSAPGEGVTLRWRHPRGVVRRDGRLAAGERPSRVPLWRVEPTGAARLVQRRRYARAAVMLPVQALLRDTSWPLTCLDVAEGGMRCSCPGEAPLAPDERLALAFAVDGAGLEIPAEVVWVAPASTGEATTVAFRFPTLSPRDADRLRRFVFRVERQRVRLP